MTDNEIIKALECCGAEITTLNNCSACPMNGKRDCMTILYREALDLINRQKAEIERLEHQLETLCLTLKLAKSEAIKEFAERLKEEATVDDDMTWWIANVDIDKVLKEMVGE